MYILKSYDSLHINCAAGAFRLLRLHCGPHTQWGIGVVGSARSISRLSGEDIYRYIDRYRNHVFSRFRPRGGIRSASKLQGNCFLGSLRLEAIDTECAKPASGVYLPKSLGEVPLPVTGHHWTSTRSSLWDHLSPAAALPVAPCASGF